MKPHRLWWQLIQHNLHEAKMRIPAILRGNVQFEAQAFSDPVFFYLKIDGSRTFAGEGRLEHVDVHVKIDDTQLARLLRNDHPFRPAFRVSGQKALYDGFFEHLHAMPPAISLLSLRTQTNKDERTRR